jgi:hypothetical protein
MCIWWGKRPPSRCSVGAVRRTNRAIGSTLQRQPICQPRFFQLKPRRDRNKVEDVKAFALIVAILATAYSSPADSTNYLENFSPHFSTNTEILWQATNHLPESFWIYKRLPTRPFLASVISNAVVLASMQDKQIPKPSTNEFFIATHHSNPMETGFIFFLIQPATTTISFCSTNNIFSTNDVPDNEAVTRRAFECAARFGLDRAYLVPKNVYNASNAPGRTDIFTNGICARGIYLSRKLDGIGFFGDANDISEGFSIEFGSHGQIRSFELVWPNLERYQNSPTASREEVMRCIRERRILIFPDNDEPNYFERVKGLASAKSFTITKITPYYQEGVFGETPANDSPAEFIAPFAELEAIADFGNSNATVRLVSPIMSSDVTRLLAK